MKSRRQFLATSLALAGAGSPAAAEPQPSSTVATTRVSLNGVWQFRIGQDEPWKPVTVPHTWQISPATADIYGTAWYERDFFAEGEWARGAVRIEFEGVFHSAAVWLNDRGVGEHPRRGYTAFTFDLGPHLRWDQANRLRVRVDSSFDEHMLPRGRSSDWAHDGGIYRPVHLLVTPAVFVERVEIEAEPDLAARTAELRVRAVIRNTGQKPASGAIALAVHDDSSALVAMRQEEAGRYSVKAGETVTVPIAPPPLKGVQLWHFDHPHLYELSLRLTSGHEFRNAFGVRKIEARGSRFYLNGEPVRLMGVERMAGSNPEFGMAEPSDWIRHDHADMKNLNCVYTRVHWPQDRRVLDYCDRHGMLVQTEVPAWGPATFAGMDGEPSPDILQNGLEQLREMIARDRNHPCIFSWGVCNEIGGQKAPAYAFARRMYEEARRVDPGRLVTYASHSLHQTPEKDVAGLMDYIMWNEYYESWQPGTVDDMARALDRIHEAFPTKPIVISEYGYCACTADRPEGDERRIAVLQNHTRAFREREYVAGLIFFCYNDYRTHVGDKGAGVMKQRVHGVVDVLGARKPSYEVLRNESGPIESLDVAARPGSLEAALLTRKTIPAYSLRGYKLRAIVYGAGDIPLEWHETALPELAPGQRITLPVTVREAVPLRVRLDVVRPTGSSAYTAVWRPSSHAEASPQERKR